MLDKRHLRLYPPRRPGEEKDDQRTELTDC